MSVTKLTPATEAPVEDVIKALESALEKARSGELRTVVVAGSCRDRRIYTHYQGEDLISILGLMGYMMHRISNEIESWRSTDL